MLINYYRMFCGTCYWVLIVKIFPSALKIFRLSVYCFVPETSLRSIITLPTSFYLDRTFRSSHAIINDILRMTDTERTPNISSTINYRGGSEKKEVRALHGYFYRKIRLKYKIYFKHFNLDFDKFIPAGPGM